MIMLMIIIIECLAHQLCGQGNVDYADDNDLDNMMVMSMLMISSLPLNDLDDKMIC